MNNTWTSAKVFMANVCWFLSCLPNLALFVLASYRVRRQQEKLLQMVIKRNAGTDYGQTHGFRHVQSAADIEKLPLSEYADYVPFIERVRAGKESALTHEAVILLQPTSGTSGPTKLIPYTRSLQKQFRAAIDPWMGLVYLHCPSILWGRQYWSISPATHHGLGAESKVPVGFAEDAEYLGFCQRQMAKTLFVVPPEIAQVQNHAAFQYLTLLFLLRERRLRLISVWHPSFLTLLLDAIEQHLPQIVSDIQSGHLAEVPGLAPELRGVFESHLRPDPARAAELAGMDLSAPDFPMGIWPGLKLISCWTSGLCRPWILQLQRRFPNVPIQGKGLIATEGIVSFPINQTQNVCAIRSHFYEFWDPQNQEIKRAWELEEGREYSVIITTGGGLYRYRLHDRVKVAGHYHRSPCLEFLSKDHLVSDLVGEKLNAVHVTQSIQQVEKRLGITFTFALLAPSMALHQGGYIFYFQQDSGQPVDYHQLAEWLDQALCQNFHYQHARGLSQLQPVRAFRVSGKADQAFQQHLIQQGMKAGDIKFNHLSPRLDWETAFTGAFVT